MKKILSILLLLATIAFANSTLSSCSGGSSNKYELDATCRYCGQRFHRFSDKQNYCSTSCRHKAEEIDKVRNYLR